MMESVQRIRRRKLAARWLAVAGLAFLLAWAGLVWDARRAEPARASGPVVTLGPDEIAQAATIQIVRAQSRLTLTRDAQNGWVASDRADYPADQAAIARLLNELAQLRKRAARTSNPARWPALRLDAPEDGGAGTRLRVQDKTGAVLADLVLSQGRDKWYVRAQGVDQAFVAQGDLPALDDLSLFLPMPLVQIDPGTIMQVESSQTGEPAYLLQRRDANWQLAPPWQSLRPHAPNTLAMVAEALGRLRPVDVRPAADLGAKLGGRQVVTLRNGTRVTVDALALGEQYFVRILHSDSAGQAAGAEPAASWAYEISRYDWVDFAAGLSSLGTLPAGGQ